MARLAMKTSSRRQKAGPYLGARHWASGEGAGRVPGGGEAVSGSSPRRSVRRRKTRTTVVGAMEMLGPGPGPIRRSPLFPRVPPRSTPVAQGSAVRAGAGAPPQVSPASHLVNPSNREAWCLRIFFISPPS